MRVKSFRVKRSAPVGEYKLSEIFAGLESSSALLKVFGSRSQMTKIMKHLTSAKSDFLYLDVIHVLVHVKQFLDGRELYDQAFEYVDRPTELEAYRTTVAEARRVGMDEDEILRYLRMDAADDSELGKLMEKIGVKARR